MILFQIGQEVCVHVSKNAPSFVKGKVIMIDIGEHKLVIKPQNSGSPEMRVDMDDVIEINGITKSRPVYYQPRLSDAEWALGTLRSYEVYRNHKNCKEDYPDSIIDRFIGSDIENHQYVDDLDYRNTEYFVDVPNPDDSGDSTNVFSTYCEDEARVFAQVHFLANEFGFINLISQS
jgi:hypothetical protein